MGNPDNMIKIAPDIIAQIVEEMSAAPTATPVVQKWANKLGCSAVSVFRKANEAGYSSGKKTRVTKGTSKIPRKNVLQCAEIIRNSGTKNGIYRQTTAGALRIMEINGLIEPGSIHPNTMNVQLRKMGLNKRALKQPKPHTTVRSKHPNDVHQIDATVCDMFYLDGQKIRRRDITTLNKNKPGEYRQLANVLWFWGVVDHTTNVVWGMYFHSPGENTADALETLWKCWSPKTEPGHAPFCGIPKKLMTDKGPVFKSNAMQRLLKNFDIEWHTSGKRKNPRARGSIEGAHNIVKMGFEANLKEEPISTLDELNAQLDKWLRHFNATAVHSRHGHARYPAWAAKVGPHLRLPPADFEAFEMCATSAPVTKTIGRDRYINFKHNKKGGRYWINDPEYLIGDKVDVNFSPFRFPDIIVTNVTRPEAPVLSIAPALTDEWGFPIDAPFLGRGDGKGARARNTITQNNEKELDQVRKEFNDGGGLLAHNYPEHPVIQMTPHARAPQIQTDPISPLIQRREAIDTIIKELGGMPLNDQQINIINNAWADAKTLTKKQINNMIETLETETEQRRQA